MPFDWAPNTPQCLRGIGKSPAFHGSDLPIRAGQPGPSQTTDNACGGLANPPLFTARICQSEPGNQQCLRRGLVNPPPDTNNARGGLPNPRLTWLGSANPSRAEADSFQNLYLQIKNNYNLIVCQAEIFGWSFPHVHVKMPTTLKCCKKFVIDHDRQDIRN